MSQTRGSQKELIETYGEVAKALGPNVSAVWARKLWKKYEFKLKNRLSPRGWIRMTPSELMRFKRMIQKGAKQNE